MRLIKEFSSEVFTALLWSCAAGLLAWTLSTPSGVSAAVLGAAIAVPAGSLLAGTRLRFALLSLAGLLVWTGCALAAHIFVVSVTISNLLGPDLSYAFRESLFWLGSVFVVCALMQAGKRRHAGFAIVEIVCLTSIVAGSLAAHREGFLNRPFSLADPSWAHGYNPVTVLITIGLLLTALCFFALAAANRRARLSDFALLCLILALILAFLPAGFARKVSSPAGGSGAGKQQKRPTGNQPQQPPPESGGQSGKPKSASSGGGSQKPSTQPPPDDNEFPFDNPPGDAQQRPVAVVNLHDDYDPPFGVFYFRQTAFSQFNGQRLVQDTSGAFDKDLSVAFPSTSLTLAAPKTKAAPLRSMVALVSEHARPLALVNAFRLKAIPNPDPRAFNRAYDVESYVLREDWKEMLRAPAGDREWSPNVWKQYTAMPADPRYRQLADEAIRPLNAELRSDPVAKALAIVQWLNKNGVYSAESTHAGSPDPIAGFLFGDRTGYCIYFAHAACYLMRSQGIPARVGAGYATPARQRGRGSSILIRAADSHAWPEIYLRGYGWVVFDVTPERSLAPRTPPVDSGLQSMMGDMARKSPLNGRDLQEEGRRKGKSRLPSILQRLLATLLYLSYGVKIWRRLEIHFCPASRAPRLAYRMLLDHLAEVGRTRRVGETREAFAQQNQRLCPALEPLTRLHLRATLGRRYVPIGRAGFLEIYRRGARQLSQCVPLWRRTAGLADPTSWMRAR